MVFLCSSFSAKENTNTVVSFENTYWFLNKFAGIGPKEEDWVNHTNLGKKKKRQHVMNLARI